MSQFDFLRFEPPWGGLSCSGTSFASSENVNALFLFTMTMLGFMVFSPTLVYDDTALARGPFARMHMLLQKTIFEVEVMRVDIQVASTTQEKLKDLVSGKSYSESLADQVVKTVLETPRAVIRMKFLRDVNYADLLSEFLNGIVCVRKSGIINERQFDSIYGDLPRLFAPLSKREIKEGDELFYIINNESTRTLFRTQGNQILIDHIYMGQGPRQTLLGSQFAPCSDFREPLVRSLFEPES